MDIGLFPGQGIPAPAVLEGLPQGDPLIERASAALGFDLRKRVRTASNARGEALPTWLAQPAIFVAGCISYRRARSEGRRFEMLAGHSMGEYAALVASGSITFEQGLRLVEIRGLAMQRAAQMTPGGMLAVMGLPADDAESIAHEAGAGVANHNAPEQVVLSGDDGSLARASELAKAKGGRALLLSVVGPFHTEAMQPARTPLIHALVYTRLRTPKVPVLSNVTGRPYRAPGEIRKLLVEQLTRPVLWRQSLEWAKDQGITNFEDFGPGNVVGGLARKTLAQEGVTVGA